MMHKVLFDCDNTMGVKDRDVDDGLALLYLLGHPGVDLVGVTTTYGNSTIEIVHENTKRMLAEIGAAGIPLHQGAAGESDRKSPAAEFLARTVSDNPGKISLLATGSLTNLCGAHEIDPDFFRNVGQVVLMGGITEPLIINGQKMDELNFSCDPEAAYSVLSSGVRVTVLTGHTCLQAAFGAKEFRRLEEEGREIYRYIRARAYDWYQFMMKVFGVDVFYNWDIVAAVYVTHPELFSGRLARVVSTSDDLKEGMLRIDECSSYGYAVNIPLSIRDLSLFNETIFQAWANIELQ